MMDHSDRNEVAAHASQNKKSCSHSEPMAIQRHKTGEVYGARRGHGSTLLALSCRGDKMG